MSESELVRDLQLAACIGSQECSYAAPVSPASGMIPATPALASASPQPLSQPLSPYTAAPLGSELMGAVLPSTVAKSSGSLGEPPQASVQEIPPVSLATAEVAAIANPLDDVAMELFANEDEARYYIRHLLERVQNLEQALDQTLTSYAELRAKMQDQVFLERQLAATEEYSHLQQHEIERLRRQLVEQQPQQVSILEEKLRLAWDRVASLEAQLEDAHQQLTRLGEQWTGHTAKSSRSSSPRDQLPTSLADVLGATSNHPVPVGSSTIASLLQELLKAQAHIKALEAHIADQQQHQDLIQQAYQELETEHLAMRASIAGYDPDQVRTQVRSLEQQVGDLQEQILMQEQQAEEYETAIHHWKDRYITSQQKVCRLKELLTTQLPNLPSDLVALLETIQPIHPDDLAQPVANSPKPGKPKRKPKIDLPEFLTRQRPSTKSKSS